VGKKWGSLNLSRAFFSMLRIATMSLPASKPQAVHLIRLCPTSSIFPPHLGHVVDVPLGSTSTTTTPRLAACHFIHHRRRRYANSISLTLCSLGNSLIASFRPVKSSTATAQLCLLASSTILTAVFFAQSSTMFFAFLYRRRILSLMPLLLFHGV